MGQDESDNSDESGVSREGGEDAKGKGNWGRFSLAEADEVCRRAYPSHALRAFGWGWQNGAVSDRLSHAKEGGIFEIKRRAA